MQRLPQMQGSLAMPGPQRVSEFVAVGRASPAIASAERSAAPDHVLLFSNGQISRKQAMRLLGVSYGELLDRLSGRELPLPRVTDEEANRMADLIVALSDQHEH